MGSSEEESKGPARTFGEKFDGDCGEFVCEFENLGDDLTEPERGEVDEIEVGLSLIFGEKFENFEDDRAEIGEATELRSSSKLSLSETSKLEAGDLVDLVLLVEVGPRGDFNGVDLGGGGLVDFDFLRCREEGDLEDVVVVDAWGEEEEEEENVDEATEEATEGAAPWLSALATVEAASLSALAADFTTAVAAVSSAWET